MRSNRHPALSTPRLSTRGVSALRASALRAFALRAFALRAFASLALLTSAGCGPAPYMLAEDPPPRASTPLQVAEGGPRAEAPDRWIPEVYPRPNPFIGRPTWVGHYDCPQGRTHLTLRVTDARGSWVRAVFDFRHDASGAAGQYYVAGPFDEGSGRVVLLPGPWINQPENYFAVGMDGTLSRDGKTFTGKIKHPDCGAFQVRPAD